MCALAEFISSLPEVKIVFLFQRNSHHWNDWKHPWMQGTTELKICFSCSDRIERDTLALSIRSLICLPSHYTRIQRMQTTFPWLFIRGDEDDNERPGGAEGDSSERGIESRLLSMLPLFCRPGFPIKSTWMLYRIRVQATCKFLVGNQFRIGNADEAQVWLDTSFPNLFWDLNYIIFKIETVRRWICQSEKGEKRVVSTITASKRGLTLSDPSNCF